MKLTTDVQYKNHSAVAAGILFPYWNSDDVHRTIVNNISEAAPYEPGSFYKRELPCILSLLDEIFEDLEAIVIDGFVTLGKDGKDGLGMHLYNAINKSVPVIGVAKKPFSGTPDVCKVYRGDSGKPLYVTSTGIGLNEAKAYITSMHGNHRIPTILKRVDQLCRGIYTSHGRDFHP